jgi:aspartate/methionine/tyrosine aminotransferase
LKPAPLLCHNHAIPKPGTEAAMALPFLLKKLLVRTGVARFLPAAKRMSRGCGDSLHYYGDRVLGAPLDELCDPAAFPEALAADVLNLNQPAPQFESPVTGVRVVADRLGNPPAEGLLSLRQAIADEAKARGRLFDPRTEVVVTHGASAAYAAALDAFANTGTRVVLFDPCSPLFAIGAKSRRAAIRWVPTTTEAGRFRFDPDALYKAFRGASLFVLSEPNNPTGATLGDEELEQIAWAANRSDVLIYLDESFARFRYDESACRLPSLPGMARRTLIAGSLTQGYSLGSVRVGWLTGPRQLVGACTLTASLAAPFVPTVCQQIALRAVQADEDLFGPVLEEFRDRRRYASDKLKAMGLAPSVPAGGYFFWVPVARTGLTGRAFAERLVKEHRVVVGPGDVFGPGGTDFVRISFAAEDGRLREGLSRLAQFVGGLSGKTPMPVPDEAPPVVEDRPPSFTRV